MGGAVAVGVGLDDGDDAGTAGLKTRLYTRYRRTFSLKTRFYTR